MYEPKENHSNGVHASLVLLRLRKGKTKIGSDMSKYLESIDQSFFFQRVSSER